MKKLAIFVAVAMIAAFSAPAMADVEIGGSYRVVGERTSNVGYNTNNANDEHIEQRLRIPVTWTVNDNVKAYLRADWTEHAGWGNNAEASELAIDYAWVSITQGIFSMKAGDLYTGYGLKTLYDSTHEGFDFNFDLTPVKVGLSYGKISENGANTDDGANDDTDAYGLNIEYAADAFTGGLIYARLDDNSIDDTRYGYGAYVKVPVGGFALAAELDMLGGDNGAGTDYEGLQFMGDFSGALSDMATVGLAAVYAQGTTDPTEAQINTVRTDWTVNVMDFMGALAYDEGWFAGSVGIFELSPNSGSMGLALRGSFAATEAITAHLKLGYLQPEESDVTALDSITGVIGSVDYAWMPNVTLSLGAAWISPDFDVATVPDDALLKIVARLGVNF